MNNQITTGFDDLLPENGKYNEAAIRAVLEEFTAKDLKKLFNMALSDAFGDDEVVMIFELMGKVLQRHNRKAKRRQDGKTK